MSIRKSVLLYGWIFAVYIFASMPELDLYASKALFDETEKSFLLQIDWYDRYVRNIIRPSMFFAPIIAVVFLLASEICLVDLRIKNRAKFIRLSVFSAVWLIIQYPIAVYGVDAIIKPLWGRARPSAIFNNNSASNTVEAFSPVYQFSDACSRNCSFVSSDVTFVSALFFVYFACYPSNNKKNIDNAVARKFCLAGLATLVALTAFGRVGAGAHFLSDVIFAALIASSIAMLGARITTALWTMPLQTSPLQKTRRY